MSRQGSRNRGPACGLRLPAHHSNRAQPRAWAGGTTGADDGRAAL